MPPSSRTTPQRRLRSVTSLWFEVSFRAFDRPRHFGSDQESRAVYSVVGIYKNGSGSSLSSTTKLGHFAGAIRQAYAVTPAKAECAVAIGAMLAMDLVTMCGQADLHFAEFQCVTIELARSEGSYPAVVDGHRSWSIEGGLRLPTVLTHKATGELQKLLFIMCFVTASDWLSARVVPWRPAGPRSGGHHTSPRQGLREGLEPMDRGLLKYHEARLETRRPKSAHPWLDDATLES